MKKNLAVLGITLTLTTITYSPVYAKKIYPAEIMGRDCLSLGLVGQAMLVLLPLT